MSNQKLPPLMHDLSQYLIRFRVTHHPSGDIWSLRPVFSKNHSRSVKPESPLPLMFPPSAFPSVDLTLFGGYKFPLARAVFGVEPHPSLPLYNPIAGVPITIDLNKVCPIIFDKSHWMFFSLTVQNAELRQGWNEMMGKQDTKEHVGLFPFACTGEMASPQVGCEDHLAGTCFG